jgi:hypothetical protein
MPLWRWGKPVQSPVQSPGEWLAILRLKVVFTTPLKRPDCFALDCGASRTVQKRKISPQDELVKRRIAGDFQRFVPILCKIPIHLIVSESLIICSNRRDCGWKDKSTDGKLRGLSCLLESPDPKPRFVSFKSVCDFAAVKSDSWRQYAAFVAAEFTAEFLRGEWAALWPSIPS